MPPSHNLRLSARYYCQYDADISQEIPGESYRGWETQEIDINLKHTALVSMHAWDAATPEAFPGWYRAVEYLPRAADILKTVFPPLLKAARTGGLPVLHVVGGGDYYKNLDGYRETVHIAGPETESGEGARPDASFEALQALLAREGRMGAHNQPDIQAAFQRLDFPDEARPGDGEPIAENAHQLNAVCRVRGINHLIYIGFAVNWCLLMSPGGMLDMKRRNYLCSVVADAVTAVENHESAPRQRHKAEALWRTGLNFGFVFDSEALIQAL